MVKLYKDFFKDKEVLFIGYSSRNPGYSQEIYRAFTNNQIKVYPYNKKQDAAYDTKVYQSLEELPVMPKAAYILLNRSNTTAAVKELIGRGIQRILFYSRNNVDQETEAECKKAGVEMAYGCPLMIYGTGFHKLHAFFAGVK